MAIIYGIIQGVAEFLPISSSGHLALFQSIFKLGGTDDYFTFNIMLHLGTLAAVFVVYRKDIFPLVPAFFRVVKKLFTGKLWVRVCDDGAETADGKKGRLRLNADQFERLVILVIIGTLPLLLTVFFNDYVSLLSAYPKVIGGILIFNGVVLFISDRLSRGNKGLDDATVKDGFLVGLCQTIAVFPGLSRSGSTITAGLLCGFDREFAVKYSFILSIPAIIGAGVLEIPDVLSESVASADILPYVLGTLTAAIVGFAAMKLLMYISKKSNFTFFAYYCWAVGLVTVIFA